MGRWARHSLFLASGVYRRRPDGSLFFAGERPGPLWHAHGTTPRLLAVLRDGRLERVGIHKQRWRHSRTGETCHSRPPNDVASVRACSLIVALKLWSWLSSAQGVQRCQAAFPDLDTVFTPRTVQRWLVRATPLATATAHAIRHTLIDESEPRPVESFLPGGRSPPGRRRWRDPVSVCGLYRGLAAILAGAQALRTPTARLLAGARRRWTGPDGRFVI